MFKPGDKVRCIMNDNVSELLTIGKTYTIERKNKLWDEYFLVEIKNSTSFMSERFELYKPTKTHLPKWW